MSDRAIVIGLDRYARADWSLRAAVSDAIAFASWVTQPGAGRATAETLELFLSPHPGATIALPYRTPTRQAIHDALTRYVLGDAGRGGERLWFFYAGHAVANSSSSPDEPPVLVPPEVEDVSAYLFDNPLELKKYIGPLQVREPKTQIFFIDACRGLVKSRSPVESSTVLVWDLAKLGGNVAGAQAQQAVLYASTNGELANELGLHGLFGRALREGLTGRGPELVADAQTSTSILRFNALASFTRRRVQSLFDDANKKGQRIPVQDPTASLFRNAGDLPIDQFAAGQLAAAKLRVFVEPGAARSSGNAAIKTPQAYLGGFARVLEQAPPLPRPITWELAPGARTFEVWAPGFEGVTETVELVDDRSVVVRLKAREAPAGLESAHLPRAALPPPAMGPATGGTLQITALDSHARVTLRDGAGAVVASGYGAAGASDLSPGTYHASVVYPGMPPVEKPLLVEAGKPVEETVGPPETMNQAVAAACDRIGVTVSGGLSDPSEAFGHVATARIASLLAWAAWAARFGPNHNGHTLRKVGLAPLPPASSAVQVLVGDARRTGQGAFLKEFSLSFGTPDRAPTPVVLAPVGTLEGFAGQWTSALGPHGGKLVIAGPSLAPLAVTLPPTPHYVAVVAVGAENDGSIEIQRYLFPLDPTVAGHTNFSDWVRTSEVCARGLESRTPLLPGEAEALLTDPRLDPLTVSLVGYRLAREGRIAELRGRLVAALTRSLAAVPSLPDLHVVSALAAQDDGERHERMRAAAHAGIPLVADGYVALTEWLETSAAKSAQAPPVAVHALVRGGAWSLLDVDRTSLDTSRAAIPADALAASKAPWAERVRAAAEATVRIEGPHGPSATGFFVAPRKLVTMGFALTGPRGKPVASRTALPKGWVAKGARTARLEGAVTLSAGGPPEMSGLAIRLALVGTGPFAVAPVVLDPTPPRVGQRVAVIAHNFKVSFLEEEAAKATAEFFQALASGAKAIAPGEVVSVDESGEFFEHDCWTLAGSAGGPVVDLDSGRVIGVHYGGSAPGGAGKKLGVALPLSLLAGDRIWKRLGG